MTTCANTKLAEIRIAGKTLYVPSAEICGRIVVVTDKWIRTAQVRDEDVLEGVIVEDQVFIGHQVVFINDRYPRAANGAGQLQTEADWTVESTLVQRGASIGSGSVILCNVTIGENAIVGAGSVVTKNVPANAVVAGNPARIMRYCEASPVHELTTQAVPEPWPIELKPGR